MAKGVELATAYVSILPSMKDFAPNLGKALGSATGTAEKSGKGIGGVMFGALAGVGMSIMNKAMATISSSIGGAISRVDTLNAFPKIMSNLGYTSEEAAASINKMSDGLIGLPTTLDQMAGTVQIMAPLTKSLDEATNISLALNNALIAGGKSTQEQANAMQQYAQMLAVGKVDMQAWRSMVSAMPGQMDQLAKSLLGANAGQQDLYDAMQAGTVTFEDFNSELMKLNSEGLESGGKQFGSFSEQAKAATGGIATSLALVKTAITRNLANVIQPFGPLINQVLSVVTQGINAIGGLFSGGAEKFAGFLSGILDGSNQLGGGFGDLISKAGEIVPVVMDIVSSFSPFSLIMQTIQPIMPQIGDAFMLLADALLQILPPIAQIAVSVGSALVPVLTSLISAVLPPVLSLFTALVPIILTVVQAFVPLIDTLMNVLQPGLLNLVPVVETVFNALAPIITGALTVISGVIQTVVGLISGNWDMAWTGIKTFFQGIWDTIKAIITGVIAVVASVIGATVNQIQTIWSLAWNAVKNAFQSVWNGIVSAATGFANNVRNTFTNVVNFIRNIPSQILGFFSNMGSLLIDSGRSLIQGFIDGIAGAFEGAKNLVADGLAAIRNLFPFSPAKEGPFSGRGWVLYSGLSIGDTFTEAVADSLKAGRKDISSQLGNISNDFDALNNKSFALDALVSTGYRPGDLADRYTTGGGFSGVQQTNNISMIERDPRLVMRQLNRELEAVL